MRGRRAPPRLLVTRPAPAAWPAGRSPLLRRAWQEEDDDEFVVDESDEEGGAAKKKAKKPAKAAAASGPPDVLVCELAELRRVTVGSFRGKARLCSCTAACPICADFACAWARR